MKAHAGTGQVKTGLLGANAFEDFSWRPSSASTLDWFQRGFWPLTSGSKSDCDARPGRIARTTIGGESDRRGLENGWRSRRRVDRRAQAPREEVAPLNNEWPRGFASSESGRSDHLIEPGASRQKRA